MRLSPRWKAVSFLLLGDLVFSSSLLKSLRLLWLSSNPLHFHFFFAFLLLYSQFLPIKPSNSFEFYRFQRKIHLFNEFDEVILLILVMSPRKVFLSSLLNVLCVTQRVREGTQLGNRPKLSWEIFSKKTNSSLVLKSWGTIVYLSPPSRNESSRLGERKGEFPMVPSHSGAERRWFMKGNGKDSSLPSSSLSLPNKKKDKKKFFYLFL